MNSDFEFRLEQIAQIAQNARTSWFGLLALLVFVGVTLMGHRDSDFFAFGAETDLPVVNISVSTVSFFVAAPVLLAALYVYLHIYLCSLWVAIAKCPPRIGNGSLGDRMYPTMLCTAALVVRRWVRHETQDPIDGPQFDSAAISGLMVWLFCPIVLGVLWWRSMPYHDEWLTLWIAILLWITIIGGTASGFQLYYAMRYSRLSNRRVLKRPFADPFTIISLAELIFLGTVSWERTESGSFIPLAEANMARAELTIKPADWQHYEIWLEDWEHQFRVRECPNALRSGSPCPDDKLKRFRRETAQRWATLTGALDSPDLRTADLRNAGLRGAFLSGASLELPWPRDTRAKPSGALLQGADLSGARMEGADFRHARLEGASLHSARLEGADFTNARLEGASLVNARLDGADLRYARLHNAYFGSTQLRGADLRNTHGLTQAQLNQSACGDKYTQLPDGLTVPACTE